MEGKTLLSKVAATRDLKYDVLRAVNLIGGFDKVINEGDRVLLKPNYNSPDPPPASSDLRFLKAIVELLFEHGAGKVIVGNLLGRVSLLVRRWNKLERLMH